MTGGAKHVFGYIAVGICVAALIFLLFNGIRYSVDFRGGVVLDVVFPQTHTPSSVQSSLEKAGLHDFYVRQWTSQEIFVVLLGTDWAPPVTTSVPAVLATNFDGAQIQRVDIVTPEVARNLLRDSITSIVGMLLVTLLATWWWIGRSFSGAVLIAQITVGTVLLVAYSATRSPLDVTSVVQYWVLALATLVIAVVIHRRSRFRASTTKKEEISLT